MADAGVYVPTLAEAILHAMQAETYSGAPLAGIAVGNGCSGTEIGVCGGQGQQFRTEFLTEHAFMPRSLKNTIRAECDWKAARQSEACNAALGEMSTVSQRHLAHCFSAVIRPFCAVFPPFLCAVRLPGG